MPTHHEIQESIASCASEEIPLDSVVNLGIGIPTLITKYAASDSIYFHTENGMLGVRELALEEDIDPDLVNAGKLPIAEKLEASYFHSADSRHDSGRPY